MNLEWYNNNYFSDYPDERFKKKKRKGPAPWPSG